MKKWGFVLGLALVCLLFVTVGASADKKYAGKSITFVAIQPHVVGSKTLGDWFEQETGCKVNTMIVPLDQITEKAVLDIQSGANILDAIEYWYVGLGTLVENGVMKDVTSWWNSKKVEMKFDDYFEDFVNAYTLFDGKRYGIPYDGDMHVLWYLKPVFKKYNLNPPKTWDEYLAAEKKITAGEKGKMYGAVIMGAKSPLVIIGAYLDRLGSYGGSFLDANGKPVINSPEAIAALTAYVEQCKYALPTPSATNFDEEVGGWITGKAAMTEFWTDLGTISSDPKSSTIIGQYGVVALPKGPGAKGKMVAPMNAGFAIGVSAKSQHDEQAMAFMEYAARPDIQLKYNCVIGGIDPVRKSTLYAPEFIKFSGMELVNAVRDAHKGAVAWPTSALWFKMQEPLTDNLSLALTGAKTPKQALDDTQKAWLDIMAAK
jgi:multiple sugar transport system substrate-binding protein